MAARSRAGAGRGREPACGVDPVRRRGRWHAHARRRRHRLGQDGHPDLDRRARDRARHGRDRARPQGRPRDARAGAPRRADGGQVVHRVDAQGDSVYNPYARGGASEIADKALAGEHFTEPHYLRQAQRYLGHVVRALRRTGSEVSLRRDRRAPRPGPARAARARPARGRRSRRHSPTWTRCRTRQHSDLAGVRDRLAILAESDVGPWLDPADGRRRPLRPARCGTAAGGRVLQPRVRQPAAAQRRCSARRSCRTCRRPWRRCRAGRCRRWW